MSTTVNPVIGLLDAMSAAGIHPIDPGAVIADGTLRRLDVDGDKRGTRNGWVVLHPDHGAAGSWKTGAMCTWSSKATSRMTRAEKDAHFAAIRAAKAEAQRQREAEHQAAAQRAAELWDKARPASPQHPYLVKKRIEPGPARQQGDLLVLRIIDADGKLHGLQYIGPNGEKRMLSNTAKRGRFIGVAGSLPGDLIVIGEGFATCMSLVQQFPGACILSAIDAGNLEPVAKAIRAAHPGAEIVIAADDDRLTAGNPGLTKARAAAAAVGGKMVRPAWPEGSPESLTDFNDLAAYLMEACHA